jgi:hypothetical protein
MKIQVSPLARDGTSLRHWRSSAKVRAMDGQLTDLWYFPRPALVKRYFKSLLEGSGRLALFGPRRTGKTSLICRELLPLAQQRGMLPVYCDCWQDRSDPIGSINFALDAAMERLEVPTSKIRRTLASEVTKLGAAGFSIEFGPEPKGRPPESPFFRVDWLLGALIARARRMRCSIWILSVTWLSASSTPPSGSWIGAAVSTYFGSWGTSPSPSYRWFRSHSHEQIVRSMTDLRVFSLATHEAPGLNTGSSQRPCNKLYWWRHGSACS